MKIAAMEGAKRAAAAATAEGIKRAAKAAAMARNRADTPIQLVEPKLANLAPVSKRITPDFMRVCLEIFQGLKINSGHSTRWM